MTEKALERVAICKKCPLYKEGVFGPTCDSEKYMNYKDETSYWPKEGYKKGCGCLVRQKAMNPNSHCAFKKW